MNEIPQIFDRQLRRRRRTRAAPFFGAAAFLADRVAEELNGRIAAVNRNFPVAVRHGTHDSEWPGRPGSLQSDLVPAFTRSGGLVFDEEQLPFADASLDLYASALGLHAVNDLPGALAQIRRSLKPDGLFLAAFFGGGTLGELREALAQAELEIDGGLSPRIAPFADVRDAGGLLQRAGFALPVADTDQIVVHYENPLRLLHDLRYMGETSVLTQRRKVFLGRRVLMRAMEIYRGKFADGEGRVRATFEIIYLTGWSPHESQQQPLKPGSATTKLADALKS